MKTERVCISRGSAAQILGFLLSFIFVLALLTSAISAESATAKDMRLQSSSGTTTITNASGKSVSIREGMKLYSGYTLKTGAKSYAYVSLDSTKVVKLDASTKVQVKKSGSKLELLVASGELFFNVSAPLSSGESLNIRTSTMVTGVRGTSGVVRADGADSSSVDIYDGTVTVNTVSGGESFTVTSGESLTIEQGAAETAALTEADIPGFAAVEIAADESLQERIESATGLDVAGIVSGAQEKLASDEAEAEAAQAALDEAAETLNGGSVQLPGIEQALPSIPVIIPDFTDAPSPTDEPTAEPTTEPTDEPTDEPVNPSDSTGVFNSDATIEAAEIQAILDSGSLTLNNGAKLTINGNVDFNKSTFAINGSGTIAAASGFKLTISSSTYVYGSIAFEGEVEISGSGMLVIDSGSTLTNNGAVTSSGYITISGKLVNGNSGQITIGAGSTLENNGSIENFGKLECNGIYSGDGSVTGEGFYGGSSPVPTS